VHELLTACCQIAMNRRRLLKLCDLILVLVITWCLTLKCYGGREDWRAIFIRSHSFQNNTPMTCKTGKGLPTTITQMRRREGRTGEWYLREETINRLILVLAITWCLTLKCYGSKEDWRAIYIRSHSF